MEILSGAMIKFFLGDQSTYTKNKKTQSIMFGTYYRFQDAIIPAVLFQQNQYAFGFSYDINVSKLTPASRKMGGLEVMLRYNIAPGYGINLGRRDTKPSY
jgi:hypothetical protein